MALFYLNIIARETAMMAKYICNTLLGEVDLFTEGKTTKGISTSHQSGDGYGQSTRLLVYSDDTNANEPSTGYYIYYIYYIYVKKVQQYSKASQIHRWYHITGVMH